MKRAQYFFTCDLCGDTDSCDRDTRPPTWVTVELEHTDTERLIGEKHVCEDCCLTIKKLHEAN